MTAPELLAVEFDAIHKYLASASLPRCDVIRTDGNAIVLDLGVGSELYGESLSGIGVEQLGALIDRAMAEANTGFAFGRYGESRDHRE